MGFITVKFEFVYKIAKKMIMINIVEKLTQSLVEIEEEKSPIKGKTNVIKYETISWFPFETDLIEIFVLSSKEPYA